MYLNPNHVQESLDELNRCVRDGPMVGVKLWVARRCNTPELDPIVQRATELGAVIFQHTWIKVTGKDTAHGRWYLIDLLTRQKPVTDMSTPGGHGNPLLYLAVYEDDYRKVGNAWRICHTTLHFLWPARSFEILRHPG